MGGHSLGIGGHQRAEKGRSDIWLTPRDIVDDLGPFDLDPCAAPEPRPWPTAVEHFTETDDGLSREWHGRVWLNPPYERKVIGAWLRRMALHGSGIALTFARTETAAFHQHVWPYAAAMLFFNGRIHFHHPNGERARINAGGPSVLIAYSNSDADRLAAFRARKGRYVWIRGGITK